MGTQDKGFDQAGAELRSAAVDVRRALVEGNEAGERCEGDCCERFTLKFSHEEAQQSLARYEREQAGDTTARAEGPIWTDIHIVAPMIIPLGQHAIDPATGGPSIDNVPIHHYTCKHFDKEKRVCGIYENRPQVCRSFPDSKACRYVGCKWQAAREGRVVTTVVGERCVQRVITREEVAAALAAETAVVAKDG